MSLLVLFVIFVSLVAAQEPPRHDQYRDDPKSYCWNPASSGSSVATRQQDQHGHECTCHLLCLVDQDGRAHQDGGDQEDATCKHYCSREHCQCHVEEPCEMPK